MSACIGMCVCVHMSVVHSVLCVCPCACASVHVRQTVLTRASLTMLLLVACQSDSLLLPPLLMQLVR